jgi:hypothetical protein
VGVSPSISPSLAHFFFHHHDHTYTYTHTHTHKHRSEFRQHRSASKADILTSFNEEWNTYLHHLQAHTRTHTEPFQLGAPLSEREIENLSLEQREQLQKLKEEAAKAAKGGGGKEPPPASLG